MNLFQGWRGTQGNNEGQQEIIHDAFIKMILFLAIIPAIASSSVIYCKAGLWYYNSDHQGLLPVEGDGRSRRRLKRIYSTTPLILTIMSSLSKWTKVPPRSLFGLYLVQAASVSLQGFLNSMVYAWRRPNFTDAVLGESTPLMAHQQQAFFEESLRTTI
ncbi:hypothetical protein NHX12_003498 [Muraenolepis orangiensis]|uniref:Uncharacterized protein n=1 Tax=Muraenolepis orangiensis TaxID=630683 RepID=A0A9Q0DZB5_9TELE|nr:hypothetical protein NHX12_003498 [Muraenolepis orangiensis]